MARPSTLPTRLRVVLPCSRAVGLSTTRKRVARPNTLPTRLRVVLPCRPASVAARRASEWHDQQRFPLACASCCHVGCVGLSTTRKRVARPRTLPTRLRVVLPFAGAGLSTTRKRVARPNTLPTRLRVVLPFAGAGLSTTRERVARPSTLPTRLRVVLPCRWPLGRSTTRKRVARPRTLPTRLRVVLPFAGVGSQHDAQASGTTKNASHSLARRAAHVCRRSVSSTTRKRVARPKTLPTRLRVVLPCRGRRVVSTTRKRVARPKTLPTRLRVVLPAHGWRRRIDVSTTRKRVARPSTLPTRLRVVLLVRGGSTGSQQHDAQASGTTKNASHSLARRADAFALALGLTARRASEWHDQERFPLACASC